MIPFAAACACSEKGENGVQELCPREPWASIPWQSPAGKWFELRMCLPHLFTWLAKGQQGLEGRDANPDTT
jgi:hypothetical protein